MVQFFAHSVEYQANVRSLRASHSAIIQTVHKNALKYIIF